MYQAPNLFVLLSGSRLQGLKHRADDFFITQAGGSVCCWAIPVWLCSTPHSWLRAPWLGAMLPPSTPALPWERPPKGAMGPVHSCSLLQYEQELLLSG